MECVLEIIFILMCAVRTALRRALLVLCSPLRSFVGLGQIVMFRVIGNPKKPVRGKLRFFRSQNYFVSSICYCSTFKSNVVLKVTTMKPYIYYIFIITWIWSVSSNINQTSITTTTYSTIGNVKLNIDNIQLTSASQNQAGLVLYATLQTVAYGFTAQFTYYSTMCSSLAGDGYYQLYIF